MNRKYINFFGFDVSFGEIFVLKWNGTHKRRRKKNVLHKMDVLYLWVLIVRKKWANTKERKRAINYLNMYIKKRDG